MNRTLSNIIKSIGFATVLPLSAYAAPDPNFHIYLLLGQSNMQGAAHMPDQSISHPNVQVLQDENCSQTNIPYGQWREHYQPVTRCDTGNRPKPDGSSGPIGLSPSDTFGVTMADAAAPGVTIGLVGAAYGGAQIESFLPDCANYSSKEGKPNACYPPYGDVNGAPRSGGTTPMYWWALELGRKAQERGVIKGIIFHHGESNSGESTWLPRVKEYIDNLRSDLELDPSEVPFIAGELPRTGCCASSHNPLVQRIGEYVENGHWVSSGPMPDGTVLGDRSDRLHWSTDSVIEMGKRYAAKMLEVGNYGPVDCGTQANVPVCCDIKADPDGDGVGTQNDGQECVVTEDTSGWHPANPADVVAAINVGGSGEAIPFGDIWFDADQHFTGGTTFSTEDSISGANGSSVYNSERYGDFSYKIPVANGNYTVQLGMVEIYNTASGDRTFSVSVEGQNVIQSMDVFNEVGHDTVLLSDDFPATVTDGNLDIVVTSIVDNGTMSSILVRSTTPASSSSASSVSSVSSQSSQASSSSSSSGTATGGAAGLLFILCFSVMTVVIGRFKR